MGTRITSLANNFDTTGKLKAAGINNASLSGITALPSGVAGKMTLLSTQTASASASLSFTSGIDSTYDAYCFKYIAVHPSNSTDAQWTFQASTDGGSSYGVAVVSTNFRAYHFENDAGASLQSRSADSEEGRSNETTYQPLGYQGGAVADENCSGELWLYNPSSTTYVKHFLSRNALVGYDSGNGGFQQDVHCAGYFNTTSAIDAIDFKFATGNIDDGTIKLYGVSTS